MEATSNKAIPAAAIDLGSNSFRMLIAEITDAGLNPLLKKLATVRLGQGLSRSRHLTSDAILRALETLTEFKAALAKFQVSRIRCCGTEALRRAENARDFLAKASSLLGCNIEIIDGHEEAMLGCKGVLASLAGNPPFPLLIVDVGGSSTETIMLTSLNGQPVSNSFPNGAAIHTEISANGDLPATMAEFSVGLNTFLEKFFPDSPATLIGTGGTATAMATIDLGLAEYTAEKIHGHLLSKAHVNKIADELAQLTPEERCLLPGLDQGRGNIIGAGVEIYQEIIATIDVEGMIVSDSGLLEGILLSIAERQARLSGDCC